MQTLHMPVIDKRLILDIKTRVKTTTSLIVLQDEFSRIPFRYATILAPSFSKCAVRVAKSSGVPADIIELATFVLGYPRDEHQLVSLLLESDHLPDHLIDMVIALGVRPATFRVLRRIAQVRLPARLEDRMELVIADIIDQLH